MLIENERNSDDLGRREYVLATDPPFIGPSFQFGPKDASMRFEQPQPPYS